jgi:hypothetical protein
MRQQRGGYPGSSVADAGGRAGGGRSCVRRCGRTLNWTCVRGGSRATGRGSGRISWRRCLTATPEGGAELPKALRDGAANVRGRAGGTRLPTATSLTT